MNTFICFAVLFAVASANRYTIHQKHQIPVQSSWGLASADKVKEWDGSLSYVSPVVSSGYYPSSSYYYSPAQYGQAVQYSPAVYHSQPIQYAAEVAPKVYSGAVQSYKVVPSTWSEESYVPSTWTGGFYSAGLPTARVEKQVVAKAISAPAVKVEEVAADVAPKPFQYSTEIVHDVPAKREEVVNVASPVVASRTVSVAPQVAPQVATVNKVVSAPLSYSAWSGEVAAPASGSWVSDVKPATWTSEVKPAVWASEVKPATYVSEVKPVGWTSEVKPASWAWAQPKPAVRQASWTEVKPASWSSWSEPKPYGAVVAPIQPAFYGAEYPQTIVTNAHHAVAAPWSSTWSSAHPVAWTEPIQKRSERRQF